MCLGVTAQQYRQVLRPPKPRRQMSMYQPSAVQHSPPRAHLLLSLAPHQLRDFKFPCTKQHLQPAGLRMEASVCPALDSTLPEVPRPCHQVLPPWRGIPGRRSGPAGASRLQGQEPPKQARVAEAVRDCQGRCPNQPLRQGLHKRLSACRHTQGLQLALGCPSLGPHRQTF